MYTYFDCNTLQFFEKVIVLLKILPLLAKDLLVPSWLTEVWKLDPSGQIEERKILCQT